jgi:hypothetical protein
MENVEQVDEKQVLEDLKKLEVQKQEKAKVFVEKLNKFLEESGYGLVGIPFIGQDGKIGATVSLAPLQPK